MPGKITAKQQQILDYIKEEILRKGYPPTVREICEKVGLRSTSSVHSHLATLEENGYIRRDPTKPRAIEIIDDEFGLARREMSNIPVVGRVAAGEPLLAVENIEDYFALPTEFLPNNDTVKRFYKEDGHIRLQPENDNMAPIIVPDCEILGRVHSLYRPHVV